RTLGDVGAGDSAIRTIARFGYRWVEATRTEDSAAPLTTERSPAVALADAPPAGALPPPTPAGPSRWRLLAWPMAAALVLGLAAVAALQWSGRPQDERASARASAAGVQAVVLPAEAGDIAE